MGIGCVLVEVLGDDAGRYNGVCPGGCGQVVFRIPDKLHPGPIGERGCSEACAVPGQRDLVPEGAGDALKEAVATEDVGGHQASGVVSVTGKPFGLNTSTEPSVLVIV